MFLYNQIWEHAMKINLTMLTRTVFLHNKIWEYTMKMNLIMNTLVLSYIYPFDIYWWNPDLQCSTMLFNSHVNIKITPQRPAGLPRTGLSEYRPSPSESSPTRAQHQLINVDLFLNFKAVGNQTRELQSKQCEIKRANCDP